jgi:uncharacterized membrane protein
MLAEVREESIRETPASQVGIERFIRFVGRPWLAYGVVLFLAAWIVGDAIFAHVDGHAFDPARFPWLQLVASFFSLGMTVLILIAENHQGMVAERRAQVTLQIALVSEQKIAKVIELLESLRRDAPGVPDRLDEEADRMAEATDLREALVEMEHAQEDAAVHS